jgi:radical SAM-linked protein
VTREFLHKEREAALREAATQDCRHGACGACGVCDFKVVKNSIPSNAALPVREERVSRETVSARMRLRFGKTGPMRYLSHLELLTVFTRAVSKAAVPILFSQGFHPHPRFSFATATSVGVESVAEYMDMFVEDGIQPSEVMRRLNAVLPRGLEILDAEQADLKAPSLSTLIDKTRYRITFGESVQGGLSDRCVQFLAHSEYVIERKKKGEIQRVDLRAETASLLVNGVAVELVAGRGKPLEFARGISGDDALQADDIRIEKLEVLFLDGTAR